VLSFVYGWGISEFHDVRMSYYSCSLSVVAFVPNDKRPSALLSFDILLAQHILILLCFLIPFVNKISRQQFLSWRLRTSPKELILLVSAILKNHSHT
jgi:hypothetical protein